MQSIKIFILLTVILYLGTLVAMFGVESEALRDQFVEVQMVSEKDSIAPGETIRLGLVVRHDPKWHTYWQASATGYGTSIDWRLPEGFSVSEILWPVPMVYESQGWVEFVFEGEILLMVELTAPETLPADPSVQLDFTADWLMCTDICVPGEASGSLILPLRASGNGQPTGWAPLFAEAQTNLPVAKGDYELRAWGSGRQLTLQIDGPLPESVYFFDKAGAWVAPLTMELRRNNDSSGSIVLTLNDATQQMPERLKGVLAATPGWPALAGAPGILVDLTIGSAPPKDFAGTQGSSLIGFLALAFIGGLILNLMPCVFPVLGIKIMSFVNQTGETKQRVINHGLVFTAGVLVSFWILAAVLLLLRAGGDQLGWGFQLQSPGFVFFLTLFLFAFALNMSGLFEIGQSAMGVGSELTRKSGYTGSFFSGVLATVVATPCAAPFLAPALGAALALPPMPSFLVFTSIAIGLAAPYLILSAFPKLIQFLPKPGAWMESFKQFMSFLLYATVAFLLWVLAAQLSEQAGYPPFALLNVLLAMVAVAMGLWIYGRWGALHRPRKSRRMANFLAIVIIAAATIWAMPPKPVSSEDMARVNWIDWQPGKAESLAAEGYTVYVDFTARWCVTCQTNKAAVFSSPEVLRRLDEGDIILLRADWTNRDDRISAALRAFDRSAVPFNLVYGPALDDPIILPEILLPGIVLRAWDLAKGL